MIYKTSIETLKNNLHKKKLGFSFFPLGIGTYDQGKIRSNNILKKALKLALLNGINFIDTAPNYYNGNAETIIGDFLNSYYRNYTRKIIISTKVGLYRNIEEVKSFKRNKLSNDFFNYNNDYIIKSFYKSLKKLKVKKIDIFLIHNPENLYLYNKINNLNKVLEQISYVLEELASEKKIKYWGISSNNGFFSLELNKPLIQLNNFLNFMKNTYNEHHFKVVQAPFNIKNFFHYLEKKRTTASKKVNFYSTIKENKLFFITNTSIDKSILDNNLNKYFNLVGTNTTQKALDFVKNYSFADVNLIGMTKKKHIISNINYYKMNYEK